MAKSAGAKQTTSINRTKKTAKMPTKAAEYVSCLMELHKLQGVLLTQLKRKV